MQWWIMEKLKLNMKGKITKLIENNTCVICKEGPVKILKADITWGKVFHLTLQKT